MDEGQIKVAQKYFQTMEESIQKLPKEEQGKVYRTCAINCVKDFVMEEMRKWYKECNGDMDLMYEQHQRNEYSFYKVVEKGRVYEMGYPRCLCFMHDAGFAKTAGHCECSRQSILYVLKKLFPEKTFEVTTLHTVLGGADECRFRIEVE